jgi:hypothetical protein
LRDCWVFHAIVNPLAPIRHHSRQHGRYADRSPSTSELSK